MTICMTIPEILPTASSSKRLNMNVLSKFSHRLSSTCTRLLASVGLLGSVMIISPALHAEYLGLLSGREATPARSSDLSVELGLVTGDLEFADYQNIAARVNYRLSQELTVLGTIGVSEFGVTDGVPFGLGLLYYLPRQRISDKLEIAGKASFHQGAYSQGAIDVDISSLALEALISGRQPLMDNGLAWYSNFGVHRINIDVVDSGTNYELGVGGGLVLPTGLGEAYVGVDYIDNFLFGLGIRYFVN